MASSPIFFTLIVAQQPLGTSTKIEDDILKNCSTAAGVTIIDVDGTASPSKAIANVIGPTVPPVGIAILPPK